MYIHICIYKQADDEGDSSMLPPQIESLKSQLATNFTLTEHTKVTFKNIHNQRAVSTSRMCETTNSQKSTRYDMYYMK